MPVTKNIFIFGDSITYGQWDDHGGWANRIRRHFDNQVLPVPNEYIITYNLGVPSDTSVGLADRIKQETQSRLTPNPSVSAVQFVIAIGTNDARWLVNEDRRAVDTDRFKSNLKRITGVCLKFSSEIFFLGVAPCDEREVLKSAKKHQWIETYDNPTLRQYNELIKQHCAEAGLHFVDIYSEFLKNSVDILLCDGLHPNSAGHALIADTLLPVLID